MVVSIWPNEKPTAAKNGWAGQCLQGRFLEGRTLVDCHRFKLVLRILVAPQLGDICGWFVDDDVRTGQFEFDHAALEGEGVLNLGLRGTFRDLFRNVALAHSGSSQADDLYTGAFPVRWDKEVHSTFARQQSIKARNGVGIWNDAIKRDLDAGTRVQAAPIAQLNQVDVDIGNQLSQEVTALGRIDGQLSELRMKHLPKLAD